MSKKWIFFTDATLGKLCKWLRIIGYESLYCPQLSPHRLALPVALDEQGIILTRQKKLVEKSPVQFEANRIIFINDNRWQNQLLQVITVLQLPKPAAMFTRCVKCGHILTETDKTKIMIHVPAFIYQSHHRFHRCEQCERIYWPGTHFKKMSDQIAQIFSHLPNVE
ncbi:Mut7-C RNAse domain-containing protein [candidate division CSSED10-310 bacterium]|uniref:Mut7-C RNAse domain-containing protein n=1 Tax=candidate division CSSED10-310 bacterium TaxID=2855610 RepID=A0ABV6Z3S4_UNCC1